MNSIALIQILIVVLSMLLVSSIRRTVKRVWPSSQNQHTSIQATHVILPGSNSSLNSIGISFEPYKSPFVASIHNWISALFVLLFAGMMAPVYGFEFNVCGTPASVSLMAGKTIPAGTVLIANDAENLYVHYKTENNWKLVETHLAIASSVAELPQNKAGNPTPGRFPYVQKHSKSDEYTYRIPISAFESDSTTLYLTAHANLVRTDDKGKILQSEGAWAAGMSFPGKSWASYFTQSLQTCELQLKGVTPSAGLPGESIKLYFEGGSQNGPLNVFLAGDEFPVTWLSLGSKDVPNVAEFILPPTAKSGSLYLKQGNSLSNAVWFNISKTRVESPALEDVVLDQNGIPVAINQLLVSFHPQDATLAQALRIARLVSAEIVGEVPLVNAYQFRLPTTTLQELQIALSLIKADPAVYAVLKNQPLPKLDSTWNSDPGWPEQRGSNRVEEGAALYREQSTAGAFTPLFTAIGVAETGIDFTIEDFNGYNSHQRSNNIGIYAEQITHNTTLDCTSEGEAKPSENEAHGDTVTGMMAAELGDGQIKGGNNAGLLTALGVTHGGFNINVYDSEWSALRDFCEFASGQLICTKGGNWAHDKLAGANRSLEGGAAVLNWSFGIHKPGTVRSDGTPLTVDTKCNPRDHVYDAEFFDAAQKVFSTFLEEMAKDYPNAVVVAAAANSDTEVTANNALLGIDNPSLIVVGAHDYAIENGEITAAKASYSNYGKRVDISAAAPVKTSNGLNGNGTSFAAPLVAATVAAIQSINPDLGPAEIRKLLRASALPIKNNEVIETLNGVVVDKDVVTAPLPDGSGARLNVEGALAATIDSLADKTLSKGAAVDVELPFGLFSDVTKEVPVTVPKEVFDKVDILFLVDVSGSYGDDLTQFKSQAAKLVNAFQTAGKNVQVGLASFSDFPISPYGSAGDYAYRLDQALTENPSSVIDAINKLTLHSGNDGPESQLEALYQAVTGEGRVVTDYPAAQIASSNAGWREGAFRLIFLATDASFHNRDIETSYPGAGLIATVNQLKNKKIRVYGLESGGEVADVRNIAQATGGNTFVLSRNSAEIVAAIESAITGSSSKVSIELVSVGDFAGLIESITNIDGGDPVYSDVTPGETKTFKVTFSRSWFKDPTADHVFALRLNVVAEGSAVILEVPVIVHVKP